jgi:hypothetical protein
VNAARLAHIDNLTVKQVGDMGRYTVCPELRMLI